MSLGPPPSVLPSKPARHRFEPGTLLIRIYDPARRGWNHRRRFGPLTDMRWDHHHPPLRAHRTRSVWYASTSLQGAIGEALGRIGLLDRASRIRIAVVHASAPVDVLDLVGVAARRTGLTQEIAATIDYETCRAWARAFYDQYRTLGGIRWRGREAGSVCVVLTDRVPGSSLALVSDHGIAEPAVWPRVARAARRCSLRIV